MCLGGDGEGGKVTGVSRAGRRLPTRRFWLVAGLVGLFILFDIALFAWLIFRSLSQRELDRTLLETRAEAQDLANRLSSTAQRTGGDLFTAIALEQETQTYIDSVLRQRRVVQTVEITDRKSLYEDPQHPYTKALLSAVPIPDPAVEAQREHVVLGGEVPSPLKPPPGCVFHPRCPIAIDECRREIPDLREIKPGHRAACIRV